MKPVAAISTPSGSGGIAVIRLSGDGALQIADLAWKGRTLSEAVSHTAHLGQITDSSGEPLDQAVATVFRAPNSFTGEDTVEFSVHGSRWIQQRVLERLMELGAEPAGPGEFTRRAFLNGRMDLAQAEAVADLIGASSRASHRLAMSQMSGDFSRRLEDLRSQLVELASLLELELDFSEEEVEFADRKRLAELADRIVAFIGRLTDSYRAGKAIKEGVAVAIAGAPNAGKSTLLNRLLGEEKAIVSDIPGTTRDVIEDTREIDGVLFRFHDTAGLRDTSDVVESIGIDRARDVIGRAAIVLWIVDASASDVSQQISAAKRQIIAQLSPKNISNSSDLENSSLCEEEILDEKCNAKHLILLNKTDLIENLQGFDSSETADSSACKNLPNSAKDGRDCNCEVLSISAKDGIDCNCEALSISAKDDMDCNCEALSISPEDGVDCNCEVLSISAKDGIDCNCEVLSISPEDGVDCICEVLSISAKDGKGIEELERWLVDKAIGEREIEADMTVTNARHQAALQAGREALLRARAGIEEGLSADFIAQDVREALHHLGEVTGAVTTDHLLTSIFQSFCIGK